MSEHVLHHLHICSYIRDRGLPEQEGRKIHGLLKKIEYLSICTSKFLLMHFRGSKLTLLHFWVRNGSFHLDKIV